MGFSVACAPAGGATAFFWVVTTQKWADCSPLVLFAAVRLRNGMASWRQRQNKRVEQVKKT
jgi:hypothetical protein